MEETGARINDNDDDEANQQFSVPEACLWRFVLEWSDAFLEECNIFIDILLQQLGSATCDRNNHIIATNLGNDLFETQNIDNDNKIEDTLRHYLTEFLSLGIRQLEEACCRVTYDRIFASQEELLEILEDSFIEHQKQEQKSKENDDDNEILDKLENLVLDRVHETKRRCFRIVAVCSFELEMGVETLVNEAVGKLNEKRNNKNSIKKTAPQATLITPSGNPVSSTHQSQTATTIAAKDAENSSSATTTATAIKKEGFWYQDQAVI